MMMKLVALVALLASPACALEASPKMNLVSLGQEHLESKPMWMYKKDCWKKRPVSLVQNPGAGIDEFKPFERVEKDGFWAVDCAKDYMFSFGDKFGDNKHDYKLGGVSNVSIVHYNAFVVKEDRKAMTQKVCFEFCRTVPDMLFFGLTNGRDCYCAPYYKPMESDSSECDAVCVGAPTTMCGGKSKSSIFELHMCASTEEDLGVATGKAEDLVADMKSLGQKASDLSTDMQNAGDANQKIFGKAGDPGASDLMQAAKKSAGELEHSAEEAGKVKAMLEELNKKAKEITDFKVPAEVTKAERLMEDLEKSIAEGVAASEELEGLVALASPGPDSNGTAAQYYPIMYFVDKEFKDVPSTCTGDAVNEPIVGESMDGCASACDADVQNCVGFSYFKVGEEKPVCFLFSKFKTAVYYSGCKEKKTLFLQASRGATPDVTCVAKLSAFDGTTLKPNPSGKCEQCLKKATNADRCYE